MDYSTTLLQQLGFTEYEARAYVTLLRDNPLNGYELAKASGIPRPNIYAVLQKLAERQAVTPIDTASGVRYAPLPPEELTRRLNARYDRLLSETQQALEGIPERETDMIWNLRGYDTVLQQAQAMIGAARIQLVLGNWQPESAALAAETRAARDRGIELLTLCLQACPVECGQCRDRVFRYHAAPHHARRWLIVVRDDEEMLFAELEDGIEGSADPGQASAMHTRQPNFVQMASWYVRQSIALAAIVTDAGSSLRQVIQPETWDALQAVLPSSHEHWLDYMLALVHTG